MNNGIKIILYPVQDVAEAKATFQKFLGVEPYADQPYYVGFKAGGQDIGLVPGNPEKGMIPFYDVADIKASLQVLVDAGAEVIQAVKNVGGERLIASVRDKSGNLIGIVQG